MYSAIQTVEGGGGIMRNVRVYFNITYNGDVCSFTSAKTGFGGVT